MRVSIAFALTAVCMIPATGSAVDPYESRLDRSYRALSGSIQRAFAVPGTTANITPYRSNITSTSNPSYRGSDSPGPSNLAVGGSDSNSWGMPSRQPGYNWGPGYVPPVIDADDRRILAARNAVWELPKAPAANLQQITQYYVSKGVSPDRALGAAKADVDDYERALRRRARDAEWQAHDAKLQAQQAYVEARRVARAEFNAALQAAKQRALASNSAADAKLWLGLVEQRLWNKIYIDHDPAAYREAALFAATRGVPEAYARVWTDFAANDPARDEWRDKAAVVGDVAASQTAFARYVRSPQTNLAAAAALFEKAHETTALSNIGYPAGLNQTLAASYLVHIYARGDATLSADLPRAISWLKKLPLRTPDGWESHSDFVMQGRISPQLTTNALAAREHEAAIVAYKEDLLRQASESETYREVKADVALELYGIYTGADWALPRSRNANKADAMWLLMEAAERHMRRNWKLEAMLAARDWKRAGAFEAIAPEQVEFRQARLLGRLWSERTDGRADLSKAIAFFEKAAKTTYDPTYLVNAYLAAGKKAEALQALRNSGAFMPADQWRTQLRLAQLRYRGEAGPVDVAEGDALLARLRADVAAADVSSEQKYEEREFVRDFEFESVAAPMLARYNVINTAAQASGTEATQAVTSQHIANYASAMPRLRELVRSGQRAGMHLWAVVVLGGQFSASAEDTALARNILSLSALNGDSAALSILAQHLYLDAQAAKRSAADPTRQQAQFAEAADWLEASLKSGDNSARWPLATIYSQGLGRSKSMVKAREQLLPLIAAGDAEAKQALALWSAGAAKPSPKSEAKAGSKL